MFIDDIIYRHVMLYYLYLILYYYHRIYVVQYDNFGLNCRSRLKIIRRDNSRVVCATCARRMHAYVRAAGRRVATLKNKNNNICRTYGRRERTRCNNNII